MSPLCDLDLEDSNNNKTISAWFWIMLLHHYTKLGNKMYCDSENIIWTVTDILNLRCDLEHSNPNFSQDTPTYDAVLSNQVWLQTDQQLRRYNRNSHIWLYKLSLWPWHWTQWTNFSAWHSGLWHCITISGLATKCFVVLLTQWYCSVFTYSYVTFVNLGLPLSLTCVWGKRAKSNQYWLISNTQKVQKKTFLIRQYKTMCIFSVNHLFQFMNE